MIAAVEVGGRRKDSLERCTSEVVYYRSEMDALKSMKINKGKKKKKHVKLLQTS